jgi:hypothetical protein
MKTNKSRCQSFTLSNPGNSTALAILPEGMQRSEDAIRTQTRKLRGFTKSPVLRSQTNVFSHALLHGRTEGGRNESFIVLTMRTRRSELYELFRSTFRAGHA